MRSALIPLLLFSWGCGTRSLKPVEIEAADMCSFCRMAVSQPRYAAEIVDRDENVYKFDDIGCMVQFLKKHRSPGAAMFVRDYTDAGWISAPEAFYVRAESIPSPMGGHTIALKHRPAGEEQARRFQGTVLSWEKL